MIPVVSSHITGVEYDEGLYILRVEFRDGARYEYDHVPPELWESLRKCIAADESVGSWLHANIRANVKKHPYRRVK